MERFRFHAGLCTWTERKTSLMIKAGLEKLYGNKLQNNSIRSFGRDLTKKETSEIKKGDSAVFPIEDDVIPDTRKTHGKRKSKGAARPMQTRGNAKGGKGQSRKRQHSVEDEEDVTSDEETPPPVRSHERARYGRKDDSVAAEVDDLVMFEQSASIIDQDDASRRYSLRSTRRDAKAPERIEPSENSSNDSSTDEDYADIPALPLSGSATDRAIKDLPQVVSPPINPPHVDRSRRDPPGSRAKLSNTRKQELDAEWAQVFEHTFVAFGLKSVNYSEVPPWNEEEVHSLIDALLPTREVYFAWTGKPAPRTDPHQSYRAQFDTIFMAFQNWWTEHHPNEPLPILTGVMHWGRSVDDWEPPSKDSIYYEAFRKGYRAPRAADGGVSVWPGPLLEDTFRMRQ